MRFDVLFGFLSINYSPIVIGEWLDKQCFSCYYICDGYIR
jgi:hypothetical protein